MTRWSQIYLQELFTGSVATRHHGMYGLPSYYEAHLLALVAAYDTLTNEEATWRRSWDDRRRSGYGEAFMAVTLADPVGLADDELARRVMLWPPVAAHVARATSFSATSSFRHLVLYRPEHLPQDRADAERLMDLVDLISSQVCFDQPPAFWAPDTLEEFLTTLASVAERIYCRVGSASRELTLAAKMHQCAVLGAAGHGNTSIAISVAQRNGVRLRGKQECRTFNEVANAMREIGHDVGIRSH